MIAPDTQSPVGPNSTHHVPLRITGCLSEVASRGIERQRIREGRKRPWHDTHVVDPTMRGVFAKAAKAIADANFQIDRGCNRLNVMLTLNAEHLARGEETPQAVLRRIMKHLRNLYRSSPKVFTGVWRHEFGTDRYGGWHYHIVFHLPRGMRDRLLKALQKWLDEPLDEQRLSPSFRHPKWQAKGVRSGWHLRRIYSIDGLLDYIAKVPKDAAGKAVSRAVRLQSGTKRVREYDTFGLSKTDTKHKDQL